LVLVDRAMFRHRLFKQTFKPTNTMNDQTGTQAPAQAGIEDFNGIFQERLRGIVREGLLLMFEQEVTSLCGETYRASGSVHRRAGSEVVTIQTTSGKECISKRRVREMLPSGLEREVRCSRSAWCMLSAGCAGSFLGSTRRRWWSA